MFNLFLLIILKISVQQETDESQILELSQNHYCNSIQDYEFSDSFRSTVWDHIYDKQSSDVQNNIEKWINNGYSISSEEYFSDFKLESLPWLIIAIATLLLSLLYIVVTFRPNQVVEWVKTHTEDEFLENAKKYHKFGIISIVLINVTIIICSILILIYSSKANDGLKYSICYLSQSFDDLLNQNDNNFTGYNVLYQDFNTLQQHYADFQSNLKTLFQGRQSLKMIKQQQELISFNDQLKRYQSQTPLPIKTSSNGTDIIPFKESYFSRMKIFDYIVSQKNDEDYLTFVEYYNLVKQEEKNLYLSDQIDQVNDFYDQIFTRFSSMENASFALRDIKLTALYTKIKIQLKSINDNIEGYTQKLLTFHSNLNDDISDYSDSIMGIIIVVIIFCFFQILLWIGYAINKRLKVKKIIDVLWFFCNLLLIGLLVVNIFLHSNSQLSYDLCVYFNGIVNNNTLFYEQKILEFQDSKDVIQNCLFNDGNIYEYLNITSKIKDIRTYHNSETGLNEEIQQIHSTQADFIMKLSNNSQSLVSLVDGTIIDLEANEKQGFQSIVDQFNSFKTQPNCVELANILCSDSTEPKKIGNSNDTQMCWHPSYLITKYSANCAEQYDTFSKIKLYYQSQAQGWIAAQLKESQFVSKNSDLNIQLNQYITKFSDFNEEQSVVLASMTNLLKSTNCTFIQKDLNEMLDGMCVVYSYSIYRVVILIIIVICALFVSVLLNCLTSLKISHLDTYEEYASTKVIHLAGSSRLRGSIEVNQIQNESPMHVNSTHQEFK